MLVTKKLELFLKMYMVYSSDNCENCNEHKKDCLELKKLSGFTICEYIGKAFQIHEQNLEHNAIREVIIKNHKMYDKITGIEVIE
jgi:thioredoxin-related protein